MNGNGETKTPTVTQIVEAKLYDWGYWLQQFDVHDDSVARRYRRIIRVIEVGIAPPGSTADGSVSPQERRVIRRHQRLREAATIERTLRRMSKLDRAVTWMRYVLGYQWRNIVIETGRSRPAVFRARQRIIRTFAAAFGLEFRDEDLT